MNRKGIKRAAKQCIYDASYSPVKVSLIYFLIIIVLSGADTANGITTMLNGFIPSGDWHLSGAVSSGALAYTRTSLISLVASILTLLFSCGFKSYCLYLSRGEECGPRDLLDGFSFWGRFIWMNILKGIYITLWSLVFSLIGSTLLVIAYAVIDDVIAWILVAAAMIVIVIPPILFSYRYCVAEYYLFDHPEASANWCITQSKYYTKGHRWELFKLDLSLIPWYLLCGLTCGILLIWKMPYFGAIHAHAYNYLDIEYHRNSEQF